MVPRLRLVLLAVVTVIPLLGWAGSEPSCLPVAAALLLLLVATAGLDALWGRKNIGGLKAILPAKLRWIQGRPVVLELAFETREARSFQLRAALDFPPEIVPELEEIDVVLPPQKGRHILSCPCRPNRRGLFHIGGCYYEIPSPLGLWSVRARNTDAPEVRVYPNMELERGQVASIFLRTSQSGSFATRQVGQGRDFEKLREYVPGDGFNTIHWKATARRGHPITKSFQVEKTQEIYVVVDASRLSARLQAPGDPAKGTHLDRYISTALLLGLAAEQQSDLFGLITFSDRVLNFVRARNGKAHYTACREALYALEPQIVSPDFEEIATFVRLRLRRRALLVFLTDLDDSVLMESFQRAAELISDKHLVLVQMLQAGETRPIFTNPSVNRVDEIYQDLANHLAWHDLRQLTLSLRQRGINLSLCTNEQFGAQSISGYLRVKQRQLL